MQFHNEKLHNFYCLPYKHYQTMENDISEACSTYIKDKNTCRGEPTWEMKKYM